MPRLEHAHILSGEAFNIGSSPRHTTSLLELIGLITDLNGTKPEMSFDAWRQGDQRYYVFDVSKLKRATGWSPKVSVSGGVARLYERLLTTRGDKALVGSKV